MIDDGDGDYNYDDQQNQQTDHEDALQKNGLRKSVNPSMGQEKPDLSIMGV